MIKQKIEDQVLCVWGGGIINGAEVGGALGEVCACSELSADTESKAWDQNQIETLESLNSMSLSQISHFKLLMRVVS